MAGKIFISYRREDTRADARLVDQRLRTTFGADRIFFDVDTIQKGRDFRKVLAEALDSSNVLLAIIGPTWLTGTDATGRRRIDDPSDFVRLEIANALKRDIAVIPVLVGGAKMPREEDLPDDLRGLAYRQAAIITHDNFPHDVDGLESDVRALVTGKRNATAGRRRAGLALGILALMAAGGIALQRSGTVDRWLTAATPVVNTDAEAAKRKAALETAEKARLDAERRQAAAQQAEAARKDQEARLAAAAAAAKRQADEQEAARAAAQAKAAADLAAQKARDDEALAKRKAVEAEALRKTQEAALNRPKELSVWGWVNLTNDCQANGIPELELVKAPRFGTIQFRDDDVPIRVVSSKEREHCLGRTFKGRGAFYTVNEKDRDNAGTDQVSIRIRYNGGAIYLDDFDINLAQRKVTRPTSVRQ